MAEVVSALSSRIIDIYNGIFGNLPMFWQNLLGVFGIALVILIYAFLVWKFYKFIAKKNFLDLNLRKYNRSEHPILGKLLAGILYFLEYIVVLPVLVFVWFAVFTLFLIVLSENLTLDTIFVISAAIVLGIRMAAYTSQELSKEIAKVLPFTLLAVAILEGGLPNLEKILGSFASISGHITTILYYFLLVIIIEFIMRFFSFIFAFWRSETGN